MRKLQRLTGAGAALAVALALACGPTDALADPVVSVWTDLTADCSDGACTLPDTAQGQRPDAEITFSPISVSGVYLYSQNLGFGNLLDTVHTDLNIWDDVTEENDLVGYCIAMGACPGQSYSISGNGAPFTTSIGVEWVEGSGQDSDTGIFRIANPGFDHLAVHFGTGVLFFEWSSPINEFTISGLNNGISYFAAFWPLPHGPDDTDVPTPAPLALLGLGLIGLAALRRRAMNT